MNWVLILFATMTAPTQGEIMLSSETKFEAMCLDHVGKVNRT